MKRNLVRRTGFTLVELLVGILILLLLLIAVSTASSVRRRPADCVKHRRICNRYLRMHVRVLRPAMNRSASNCCRWITTANWFERFA